MGVLSHESSYKHIHPSKRKTNRTINNKNTYDYWKVDIVRYKTNKSNTDTYDYWKVDIVSHRWCAGQNNFNGLADTPGFTLLKNW